MPWPTVLHKLASEEIDDMWTAVVERTKSHPEEVGIKGAGYGQTAVHVACYRYPPESAVRAMLDVCPNAAMVQNQDGETPLHLACEGASEEVQLMLIETRREAASKCDKYGDAPLHLAAESGSSIELLRKIVEADPSVVLLPNKQGVTPFFKLSRVYERAESVKDLLEGGEYSDEWEKAMLLLMAATYRSTHVPDGSKFRLLHSVAGVKCPRALLRTAARFFPEQALQKDENGWTPLAIACASPIYDEPEDAEEEMDEFDEDQLADVEEEVTAALEQDGSNLIGNKFGKTMPDHTAHTTVIEIILSINPRAATLPDKSGRLPLALALASGKEFDQGPASLISAAPRMLETRDTLTHMYPFMIAAHGVGDKPSVNTVYELLRASPMLVENGISVVEGMKSPSKSSLQNAINSTRRSNRIIRDGTLSLKKKVSLGGTCRRRAAPMNDDFSADFMSSVYKKPRLV